MKYVYKSDKAETTFTQGMKEKIETAFAPLEKFLKEDEAIKMSVTSTKGVFTLKGQIVGDDNYHFRASVEGTDFYNLVVQLRDNFKEQIRRRRDIYKTKHSKKKINEPEKEVTPTIRKIKHFELESITEGIALNEMDKLGHDTYLFRNINLDDKICMLYRRVDEDYSMIVIDN